MGLRGNANRDQGSSLTLARSKFMAYDPSVEVCHRSNLDMFYLVFMACLLPLPYSAEFMAKGGVPLDVALRVILHPNRRRRTKCRF